MDSRVLRLMFEVYYADDRFERVRDVLVQMYVRMLRRWYETDGPQNPNRRDMRDASLRRIAEIIHGGPFADPPTRRQWIKHHLLEPCAYTRRYDPEQMVPADIWVPGDGDIV